MNTATMKRKIVSKNSTGLRIQEEDMQSLIRQKAFELYQQRGCLHGYAEDDWLKAEQMVKSAKRLT